MAVHLLQENEGEHRVRPQAAIVRRESLPQCEQALLADDLGQHIDRAAIFWPAIGQRFHILNASLSNVDWHRCDGGDQAGDHAGHKMQRNALGEFTFGHQVLLGLRIGGQLG